jgi:hypothetical protein
MTGTWHGGKGSSPRPKSVSEEEYATRWDAIFGRDLDSKDKVNEDGEVLQGNVLIQDTEKVSND